MHFNDRAQRTPQLRLGPLYYELGLAFGGAVNQENDAGSVPGHMYDANAFGYQSISTVHCIYTDCTSTVYTIK